MLVKWRRVRQQNHIHFEGNFLFCLASLLLSAVEVHKQSAIGVMLNLPQMELGSGLRTCLSTNRENLQRAGSETDQVLCVATEWQFRPGETGCDTFRCWQ